MASDVPLVRRRRALRDLGLLITWRCAEAPEDVVRVLRLDFKTDLADLEVALRELILAIPSGLPLAAQERPAGQSAAGVASGI